MTLYFSQRCETSCLRVTSPLQLATQFCQNGPIRAHLSYDVGDLARPPSCLLLYALQVAKKSGKRVTSPLQLERFFIRHRCVASCKKKITCNTPFCNYNCCVASCKKSRMTLYFSQRCETSCLRVTSPPQLATQFCQNGPIRAHLSQDVGDLARPPSCLLLYPLQVAKKGGKRVTSPLQLERFFYSSSLRCKLQEILPRVTWP